MEQSQKVQNFFRSSSFKGRNRLLTALGLEAPFSLLSTNFILTGYAIAIGASDLHIGLLTTLPLVASLSQFLASAVYEHTGHAKLSHILICIPRILIWFFILSIPIIYNPGHRIIPFLAAFFIRALFSHAGTPTWHVWRSNLIPGGTRGRYFAREHIVIGISGMLVMFLIGRYLSFYPKESFLGFQKVFFVGAIFGMVTLGIFTSVPSGSEPKPEKSSTNYLGLLLQVLKNNKFMYFILAYSLYILATTLRMTFASAFMLKTIGLSYNFIANCIILMTFSQLAVLSLWGYMADKYGNKHIMIISASCGCLTSILWLLTTPQYYFFIPVIYILSGIFISGMTLSYSSMLFGLVPKHFKSIYFAIAGVLASLIGAISSLVSIFIVNLVRDRSFIILGMEFSKYHLPFIFSAIAMGAVIFLFTKLYEPKAKSIGYVLSKFKSLSVIETFYYIILFSLTRVESKKAKITEKLGESRTPIAMDELVYSLDDISLKIRQEAAIALGKIKAPESVDSLIEKLQDEDSGIQAVCVSALGKIGDRRATEPLIRMLKNTNKEVRLQSALAIGEIGDQYASTYLEDSLNKEEDKVVRSAIGWAISKMGVLNSVKLLLPHTIRNAPYYSDQFILYVGNLLSSGDDFYKFFQRFKSGQINEKEYLEDVLNALIKDIEKCKFINGTDIIKNLEDFNISYAKLNHKEIIVEFSHVLMRIVDSFLINYNYKSLIKYELDRKISEIAQLEERIAECLRVTMFLAKADVKNEKIRAEHVILVLFSCGLAVKHIGKTIFDK